MAALFAQLAAPAGAQTPQRPATTASPGYLLGVDAIASDDVWAVGTVAAGNRYRVLIKHWDGTTWNAVAPHVPSGPKTHAGLNDVSAASTNDVWAVGQMASRSTLHSIIEHWDGSQWSMIRAPRRHNSSLEAVAAISQDDAWAVGVKYNDTGYQPIVVHWNGSAWRVVGTPSEPGYDMQGVSATGPDDVWAVANTTQGNFLVEHWDGSTWTVSDSAPRGASAVLANSSTDVHVISNTWKDGPIDNAWDGHTWTQTSTGLSSDSVVGSLDAASSGDAWAVGTVGNLTGTLAAHWNGSTWTAAETPTPKSKHAGLDAVTMVGSDDAWAVGGYWSHRADQERYCLIEHWDGTQWTRVAG